VKNSFKLSLLSDFLLVVVRKRLARVGFGNVATKRSALFEFFEAELAMISVSSLTINICSYCLIIPKECIFRIFSFHFIFFDRPPRSAYNFSYGLGGCSYFLVDIFFRNLRLSYSLIFLFCFYRFLFIWSITFEISFLNHQSVAIFWHRGIRKRAFRLMSFIWFWRILWRFEVLFRVFRLSFFRLRLGDNLLFFLRFYFNLILIALLLLR